MLYLHDSACISPQQDFPGIDTTNFIEAKEGKLLAVEPAYEAIPKGVLRRMSKPVRMGVGAAMPLIDKLSSLDGIIIGTANAGMEDCFYFLKQIVEYKEGLLTPGNFVQSTPNALAGQLSMLQQNKGYNITHVHLGLAFENALLDAVMRLEEFPTHQYLLGAVDDISAYNYSINLKDGWFKDEQELPAELYDSNTKGSVPGEGAAMFVVNNAKENASAKLLAINTVHSKDEHYVEQQLRNFIANNLPANQTIGCFISGENGDNRLTKFYTACEKLLPAGTPILRYKQFTGEYPTATAMALRLACMVLRDQALPQQLVKIPGDQPVQNILLYNSYKGAQHSFILLSNPA